MDRAGFDSLKIVGVLETLKALRKKGPYMTYIVYKSYPYISERIANLKTEVKGVLDFDSYINLVSEEGNF